MHQNSQTEIHLAEIKAFLRYSKESFFIRTSKQATLAHIACILQYTWVGRITQGEATYIPHTIILYVY